MAALEGPSMIRYHRWLHQHLDQRYTFPRLYALGGLRAIWRHMRREPHIWRQL